MKILLVLPVSRKNVLGKSFAFNLPFLGLITLASHTPEDVEVMLIDERVDKIDFNEKYDLVGITVMTPLAPRAYQIAHKFREKGIKVVLGGMHASALPEEVLEHADSVVIGEGEKVWSTLLEDVKNKRLQKRYQADNFMDLAELLAPKREFLNKEKCAPVEFVETTRGCPFGCHFCSVTHFFGGRYRTRPVDDVIEEIKTFKPTKKRFSIKNVVFFVDDNIIGRRDHAKELFKKIKPYGLNWLGQASINIAKDEEMLKLVADSGCMGLLIGFESLSDDVLKNVAKKANKVSDYMEAVKKIHSYGLGIMGSFVFGFDADDTNIFSKCIDFVEEAKLEGVYLGILTPYPGTRFYDQYKREGRLLHSNWELYDTSNVVFKPNKMTEKELKEGYLWAYKRAYSLKSMFKRLKHTTALKSFVWPMNVGFNLTVRKIAKALK
ncbi:MAG: B12-binding domain-containing radical SAM protein [Candidatus Omnitrophica bacterium]|nr:B12-binding domain-containing radical SAM protein [Candidatus Omnitrophota bacterium]